jgi:rod shape determining protein RodA
MDLTAGRGGLSERFRGPIRGVDPVLLAVAVALAVVGLFMVFSATHRTLVDLGLGEFSTTRKQALAMLLGITGMVVAAAFDYRLARIYAPLVYVGVILLLVLVRTPLGAVGGGAQRGFELLGFQFTPSEYMKLALIVTLSGYLADLRSSELTLRHVFRATALAAFPAVLVFVQPDLGTAMILAAVLVGTLVVAGAKARHLAVLGLSAFVLLLGSFQLGVIQDYQIDRVTALFDAPGDPRGTTYNRDQSLIAIGAGGVLGRGYLQGTQTNLDFVPEQHSDFIFTVVGEEFGFVGASFVLLLFGALLWRAFRIAMLSKDRFGTYVAAGIATMLTVQIFVNVGMTLGIMPITGIPLPFVSYGGSSLVANFLAIGLLLNIHARRFNV